MNLIAMERITPRNAMSFKAVRLNALKDTPYAFGSTYASESKLSDEEWIRRATDWDGTTGVGFLAMDESRTCGIAGSLLEQHDMTRALLISMWVAPEYRRHGVGRLLVTAIVDWAQSQKVRTLFLMVTSRNESAMRFYEQLGFRPTGKTEPYPNDPAEIESEMSKPIS